MAEAINWSNVAFRARRMTTDSLIYAYRDCVAAAATIPEDAIGKDASYYRDEASVYRQELSRRGRYPAYGPDGTLRFVTVPGSDHVERR
jgi:hypothetical protein